MTSTRQLLQLLHEHLDKDEDADTFADAVAMYTLILRASEHFLGMAAYLRREIPDLKKVEVGGPLALVVQRLEEMGQ